MRHRIEAIAATWLVVTGCAAPARVTAELPAHASTLWIETLGLE